MFTELATMLTDYALALLCSLLGFRLWTGGQAEGRMSVRYWAFGMGSLAVASFAGGTVHGWTRILPEPVVSVLWKIALVIVGVASCCFFIGTLTASFPPPLRRLLTMMPVLQLAGYVMWIVRYSDFRYVLYNYGVTFLCILVVQMYELVIRKSPPAGWIVVGVSLSFLAAIVQRSGIALHPSFNHNDLYHVVQMAGMALLYRGASMLNDRQ